MKIFFLDLVHDLREKRLWPVAAVMLLALLAIPVIVMKPAEDPAPSSVSSEPTAAKLPDLKQFDTVADASTRGGSQLDVFDPKNPFKPPASVLSAKADQAGGTASSATSASSDAKSGGSGSGGSGGGTTSPGTPSPTSPAPQARPFTYVADVKFGRSGRRLRTYRGLRRLEMLPSTTSPLLIFLGTDPDGGNAVFLVDSTLTTTGEGTCTPSQAACATLALGPGAEHEFVDPEGRSYTLLIDHIRPVSVSSSASASASGPRAAAAGGRSPGRRFQPLIADLMTTGDPAR